MMSLEPFDRHMPTIEFSEPDGRPGSKFFYNGNKVERICNIKIYIRQSGEHLSDPEHYFSILFYVRYHDLDFSEAIRQIDKYKAADIIRDAAHVKAAEIYRRDDSEYYMNIYGLVYGLQNKISCFQARDFLSRNQTELRKFDGIEVRIDMNASLNTDENISQFLERYPENSKLINLLNLAERLLLRQPIGNEEHIFQLYALLHTLDPIHVFLIGQRGSGRRSILNGVAYYVVNDKLRDESIKKFYLIQDLTEISRIYLPDSDTDLRGVVLALDIAAEDFRILGEVIALIKKLADHGARFIFISEADFYSRHMDSFLKNLKHIRTFHVYQPNIETLMAIMYDYCHIENKKSHNTYIVSETLELVVKFSSKLDNAVQPQSALKVLCDLREFYSGRGSPDKGYVDSSDFLKYWEHRQSLCSPGSWKNLLCGGWHSRTLDMVDQALSSSGLGARLTDAIKKPLLNRIAPMIPDTDSRPVSFVFAGADSERKQQIARSLADSLSLNFLSADCALFERREAEHRDLPSEVVYRDCKSTSTSTEMVRVAALQRASFGLVGWLIGPPRGHVARDTKKSAAELISENSYNLVYMENIESCGREAIWAINSAVCNGVLTQNNQSKSISTKNCIFIFSSVLPTTKSINEFVLRNDFAEAWRIRIKTEALFIKFCNIIIV